MKQVDKETFEKFVLNYPRNLDKDVFYACDPPLVSYNDFIRAPYWPDSIVATQVGDVYKILEDINAPVVSDRKPDLDPLTDQNGTVLQEGDEVIVQWGVTITANGRSTPTIRRDRIKIRDEGTIYQRWSFESCHNDARGFNMVKTQRT